MFIDSANINLQRCGLWPIIEKNKYKIDVTNYSGSKESEISNTYRIVFKNKLVTEESTYWIDHAFEFKIIDDRFRLHSMHSYWSSRRDNKR